MPAIAQEPWASRTGENSTQTTWLDSLGKEIKGFIEKVNGFPSLKNYLSTKSSPFVRCSLAKVPRLGTLNQMRPDWWNNFLKNKRSTRHMRHWGNAKYRTPSHAEQLRTKCLPTRTRAKTRNKSTAVKNRKSVLWLKRMIRCLFFKRSSQIICFQ